MLVHGAAGLGLGVVLLAATASPVGAQTQFAAVYAGTTTQTLYSGRIPTLVIDLVVTGMERHVGEFSGVGQKTVVLATETFNGTYTFTFANGDTLTATAQGVRKVCTASGVYCLQEILTITGGTGVYEGAWGNGVGLGAFDAANDQIAVALTGTIYTASPATR